MTNVCQRKEGSLWLQHCLELSLNLTQENLSAYVSHCVVMFHAVRFVWSLPLVHWDYVMMMSSLKLHHLFSQPQGIDRMGMSLYVREVKACAQLL